MPLSHSHQTILSPRPHAASHQRCGIQMVSQLTSQHQTAHHACGHPALDTSDLHVGKCYTSI